MLSIVNEAAAAGQIFGMPLLPTDEDDEPWTASPSGRNKEPPIEVPPPKSVEVVLGNQVYIDRSKLPPGADLVEWEDVMVGARVHFSIAPRARPADGALALI